MNLLKVGILLIAVLSLCSSHCDREEPGLLIQNAIEFEGDGLGCGSFYVYKQNNGERLLLEIHGNREALELDMTVKEFAAIDERLTVNILKFDDDIGSYACDDVANDQANVIETWTATEGNVFIQIREDRTPVNAEVWETDFSIDVLLVNATFVDPNGKEYVFEEVLFSNVTVGWLPG